MARILLSIAVIVLLIFSFFYFIHNYIDISFQGKKEVVSTQPDGSREKIEVKKPESISSSNGEKRFENTRHGEQPQDRISIKTIDSMRAEDNLSFTRKNRNLSPANL